MMNKGIKAALRQTDETSSIRDGMDIALCKVYPASRLIAGKGCKLQYSGANRPLWIIRNGQSVMEEIKSTKKAIGGFTEDAQEFESHEIELNKGDTFYIFSDGYADTFSGNNKKLTTKKMKQILIDIRHQSMEEHEKYLAGFIENWKADTIQIDDILVIGVRV